MKEKKETKAKDTISDKSKNESVNNDKNTDSVNDEKQAKSGKTKKKIKASDSLNEKNKELQEKIEELNDKYLRLYSEFDNYRKRTIKEKQDMSKIASADVIKDLLPVIDDFERSIKFSEDTDNIEAVIEGVKLIYTKLKGILETKGLEVIDAKGKEFDTDLHEAVTNYPAPSEDLKGKIIDEVEKGYLLGGKVIRFSKVVVGN